MNEPGAPERLRLKVTGGNAAGSEIEVHDELLLGRHAPPPGQLGDDIEISREHARIRRADDADYVLEDLGSKNGTLLNGREISGPEELTVGDTIELGQTTLVVQYSAPPPPAGETPASTTVRPLPDLEEAAGAAAGAPEGDAAAPGPLSLRVELDPQAGEARMQLGEGSDTVTLRWEDGRWRFAGAP